MRPLADEYQRYLDTFPDTVSRLAALPPDRLPTDTLELPDEVAASADERRLLAELWRAVQALPGPDRTNMADEFRRLRAEALSRTGNGSVPGTLVNPVRESVRVQGPTGQRDAAGNAGQHREGAGGAGLRFQLTFPMYALLTGGGGSAFLVRATGGAVGFPAQGDLWLPLFTSRAAVAAFVGRAGLRSPMPLVEMPTPTGLGQFLTDLSTRLGGRGVTWAVVDPPGAEAGGAALVALDHLLTAVDGRRLG